MILSRQTVCITNRCNLSCTYCWYETGLAEYPATTLTPDDYAAWFDACARIADLDAVFLTGGEPTLRDDFADVLRTCHDHFRDVVLLTNATTATADLADLLRAYGTTVHVSVDHVSADIADRVRGGTARTLHGISVLADASVPIQLTFILTARNHTDLRAVVDLARTHRFALEVNAVALPAMHPLSTTTLPAPVRADLAAQLTDAADLLSRPSYYARLKFYLQRGSVLPLSRCQAVADGIFIESDGAISLCGQRRAGADRLGQVRDDAPETVADAQRAAVAARAAGPCVSLDCLTVA